jgi:peptidyl-prolyl cis-trans isomerase C
MKPLAAKLIVVVLLATCVRPVWAASENETLVTWSGGELTSLDYEAALAAAPGTVRKDITGDLASGTKLLEGILVNRVLSQEAKAMGLDQDPLTARQIQLAVERLLALRRLQALKDAVVLPDFTQAAMERYKTRPQDFEVKEQVRASHILVGIKQRGDDEAKARAEEARRRALAGEPFDKLAAEYSDDPSATRNHGDLGFFTRDKMVKDFADAAFALEAPGQISDVVQTRYGYHVIRLEEKQRARTKPFEEVKDEIIAQLRQEYLTARMQEHVSAIRNDKSIKINEEPLQRAIKASRGEEPAEKRATQK